MEVLIAIKYISFLLGKSVPKNNLKNQPNSNRGRIPYQTFKHGGLKWLL